MVIWSGCLCPTEIRRVGTPLGFRISCISIGLNSAGADEYTLKKLRDPQLSITLKS